MTELVQRGDVSERRRLSRDEAIGLVAAIIHADRQDTPHDLAVAIIDNLSRNWLILV